MPVSSAFAVPMSSAKWCSKSFKANSINRIWVGDPHTLLSLQTIICLNLQVLSASIWLRTAKHGGRCGNKCSFCNINMLWGLEGQEEEQIPRQRSDKQGLSSCQETTLRKHLRQLHEDKSEELATFYYYGCCDKSNPDLYGFGFFL